MDFSKLADLLLPEVTMTAEEILAMYPKRHLSAGARVTRIAPSPTGFMHLGGVFAALAS